ncbi:MAG: hypothetical protein FJ130_06740 [Deltaproteobacteria bacterium]|nr:hypothetical protein [Deltaproteobacteria bacterium]
MRNQECDEIKRLLALNEDELYHELAIRLEESATSMYGPSALINAGRQAFDRLRKKLYVRICLESRFCNKLDDPQLNDEVTLVVTLADLIASGAIGVPIPPILLSTLLVKIGIRKFCSDEALKSNSGGE